MKRFALCGRMQVTLFGSLPELTMVPVHAVVTVAFVAMFALLIAPSLKRKGDLDLKF